jgi:hypothetical protein
MELEENDALWRLLKAFHGATKKSTVTLELKIPRLKP